MRMRLRSRYFREYNMSIRQEVGMYPELELMLSMPLTGGVKIVNDGTEMYLDLPEDVAKDIFVTVEPSTTPTPPFGVNRERFFQP